MKKIFITVSIVILMGIFTVIAFAQDDMLFGNVGRGIKIEEGGAPSGNPPTGQWWIYARAAGIYIEDDAGTATLVTAGTGNNTLDEAYDQGGAGAGRSITADTGAVAISNTDADAAFLFTLNASPGSAAALGGAQITVGANSTQDALEFANSGSGYDIYGTSGTWTMSKAGALVGASADLSGELSADGNIALGNGTGTLAVNTSSWDISTAGAMSGFSTLALTGDISLANGKAVQSSSTTGETMLLKGYDVDNTTYRNVFTITNGNTIAAALGTGLETLAIDTTTWDVSTLGAFTGVADITGTAGEAMGITIATDGAADDLTLSITGSTDSSILLSSTGTGADAIGLSATAGTIKAAGDQFDFDTTNDINITVTSSTGGEDLLLNQAGANDSSITLTAAGTGTDAIGLQASAGGVDIDSAASFDTSISGGQVALVSKDNAASAISLTANVGASETIVVTNTQGTSESAITLASTAGGVDVDAAAAKDLDLAGGQVKLVSKDDAAGAISLTANIGTSETITVTNTQGTAAGAITLTATAGGITLSSSAGVATSDPITGDGTAALGGFLQTVTNDADGKNLTVTESGTTQTNAGAVGAAAWVLPAAAAGLKYHFVVMAAQELRPTPAAGDVINIAGVAGDAAEYWTANAIGESLTLVAVDGTNWIAESYTGTWTQQTP